MSGILKVLSIKQPWAQLIAEGLKDIENRTWKTNYRGKILIHSTKQMDKDFPLEFDKERKKLQFYNGYSSAIIGEVEILDCVKNHNSIWAETECWNFVLGNAVLYKDPLLNISGKLGIWNWKPE